jgi:hypothetical protein
MQISAGVLRWGSASSGERDASQVRLSAAAAGAAPRALPQPYSPPRHALPWVLAHHRPLRRDRLHPMQERYLQKMRGAALHVLPSLHGSAGSWSGLPGITRQLLRRRIHVLLFRNTLGCCKTCHCAMGKAKVEESAATKKRDASQRRR